MKSSLPKVLHPVCARPMLGYVLDLVTALKAKQVIAVLGHKHEQVRKLLPAGVKVAIQKKLLGTADAVRSAMPYLRSFKGTTLVLYGDTPLLEKKTVRRLLAQHEDSLQDVTLLTAHMEKPDGYGRIMRDTYAGVCSIVEERDADAVQKEIKEINTGIMCFNNKSLMQSLVLVRPNNRKKEYYLTDTIEILYKQGKLVDAMKIEDAKQALGINSKQELAQANQIMQGRINESVMRQGVTLIDPASTFISYGTTIGEESVIYPFTVIERDVKIGARCSIGPFVHLREGTQLKDDVRLGNFSEVSRSTLGNKTTAKHFCFLGDSSVGRNVTIGAGSITANFDGVKKQSTVIGDEVLIGADTVLIAPVKVGACAVTAAGSVVTKKTKIPARAIVAGVPAKVFNPKR